jgi:hypothetical protein
MSARESYYRANRHSEERPTFAGLGRERVYCGMISVAHLLRVVASDHKARADMFEALLFPQR